MSSPISSASDHYKILVVDDEPDLFKLTELSLKNLKYQARGVTFLYAESGKQAIELMQSHPDIAVILLDVVMETDSAGFDACNAIRNQLNNHLVRILLRTGQPGIAPEKQVIDEYDIDGYLPKGELTTTRLYSAVRTAIKAWNELIELERHRDYLGAIHDCATSLHSYTPIDESLQRILDTALAICPTTFCAIYLQTFEDKGNPKNHFIYLSTNRNLSESMSNAIITKIQHSKENLSQQAYPLDGSYVVSFKLDRNLGEGWIYLDDLHPDPLGEKALNILAAHTTNLIYSTVAQKLLSNSQSPVYNTMTV